MTHARQKYRFGAVGLQGVLRGQTQLFCQVHTLGNVQPTTDQANITTITVIERQYPMINLIGLVFHQHFQIGIDRLTRFQYVQIQLMVTRIDVRADVLALQ